MKAALLLLMMLLPLLGHAQQPAPAAPDPMIEQRATKLSELLRCLVCQNQTIADSNAALARDLKAQIHEQIALGRSDQEILDFMVARYGDFVLYRPPIKATTLLLWGGPFLLLIGAGWGLVLLLRRRHAEATASALSPNERDLADQLLDSTAEHTR